MKCFCNFLILAACMMSISMLSGCAAGAATAATAGYSLKSQSADSLTAEGERKMIDRAKKEIIAEMMITGPSAS